MQSSSPSPKAMQNLVGYPLVVIPKVDVFTYWEDNTLSHKEQWRGAMQAIEQQDAAALWECASKLRQRCSLSLVGVHGGIKKNPFVTQFNRLAGKSIKTWETLCHYEKSYEWLPEEMEEKEGDVHAQNAQEYLFSRGTMELHVWSVAWALAPKLCAQAAQVRVSVCEQARGSWKVRNPWLGEGANRAWVDACLGQALKERAQELLSQAPQSERSECLDDWCRSLGTGVMLESGEHFAHHRERREQGAQVYARSVGIPYEWEGPVALTESERKVLGPHLRDLQMEGYKNHVRAVIKEGNLERAQDLCAFGVLVCTEALDYQGGAALLNEWMDIVEHNGAGLPMLPFKEHDRILVRHFLNLLPHLRIEGKERALGAWVKECAQCWDFDTFGVRQKKGDWCLLKKTQLPIPLVELVHTLCEKKPMSILNSVKRSALEGKEALLEQEGLAALGFLELLCLRADPHAQRLAKEAIEAGAKLAPSFEPLVRDLSQREALREQWRLDFRRHMELGECTMEQLQETLSFSEGLLLQEHMGSTVKAGCVRRM